MPPQSRLCSILRGRREGDGGEGHHRGDSRCGFLHLLIQPVVAKPLLLPAEQRPLLSWSSYLNPGDLVRVLRSHVTREGQFELSEKAPLSTWYLSLGMRWQPQGWVAAV